MTGVAPWQLLTTVDTNLTGYEGNFLPGFARDMYGNLIAGPVIQMFMSISDPPPPWNASPAAAGTSGATANWKISSASWTPNSPLSALNRYINQNVHEVTTGWMDPNGGFTLEFTLGHLYQNPQQGARFRSMAVRPDRWTISFPSIPHARALAFWAGMVTATPGRLRALTWLLCTAAVLAMIISSVKIPAVKASRPRSFLVMSSPDKISIALCTYNGEQFLSRR